MATTNKTKYAILGVLSIKPCSGYDIKKFCDKSISYFWNENFGHIYPVLKQLEADKLIRPEDNTSESRRKIYHITEKGRQAFCEWLVQPIELQPKRSELLLKLSFGNYMPKERVFTMMNEVKERNQRNLELYMEMEKSFVTDEKAQKDPAFSYWLASLRYGIHSAKAAIKWSKETIQLLSDDSNKQ